ncbi:MAG TPA: GNAT family N-acetyltransferase [bacterium]
MISTRTVTDPAEIERWVPACSELARTTQASLCSQYLDVPLLWWKSFANGSGQDTYTVRGANFLGTRSWLEDMFVILAFAGDELLGALPLASQSVKVRGRAVPRRVVTLPGDFQLIPYMDLTVAAGRRREVIGALLDTAIDGLGDDDLLMLQYLPETSPHLEEIAAHLRAKAPAGVRYTVATTGRRGGVWPWNLEIIVSCLRQLRARVTTADLRGHLDGLLEALGSCPSTSLILPQTRRTFEEKIRDALDCVSADVGPGDATRVLQSHLADAPDYYGRISLPKDEDTYRASLGKDTRRYFQRYGQAFREAGGSFEKIASERVTERDVDDYLALHDSRWRGDSAVLKNERLYRFHRDLCARLAAKGFLSLFFAVYRGARIAVHSCIDICGRREGYMIGRDPGFEETRAGRLLYFETIRDAIASGYRTYEMGRVWFAYKASFTRESALTRNVFVSKAGTAPDLNGIFGGYECMLAVSEA